MPRTISQRGIYTLIFFGFVYALISLVNHHLFRTYALDLGLYTNALYDYSHFQLNDSTTFKAIPENLLADHFDLYLMGFSLLSYLLGTYTLLIVQIAAILFGALGVYRFFDRRTVMGNVAYPAMVFFLLFYGVFGALSFDYHSNVVAACFVPWFLLNIEKKQYWKALIWFVIILVAKENMSIWLVFIALGGIVHYWKDKKTVLFLSGLMIFSAISFVLITSVIMPAFSNNGLYPHFHYGVLGGNAKEALIHLLSHPVESVLNLFQNHTGNEFYDGIKAELHWYLLLSGLPFLFRYPGFLIMLAPIFAQKLYHDNPMMWSIGVQYNIEFAPIMAIGIFMAIEKINIKWLRIASVSLVLVGTTVITVRSMDRTTIYTNKENLRVYSAEHYGRPYNISEVRKALKQIPDNVPVSAQTNFVSHLSLRDHVYTFPNINDAQYILITPHESPYPITDSLFNVELDKLTNSDEWDMLRNKDSVFLFQRK